MLLNLQLVLWYEGNGYTNDPISVRQSHSENANGASLIRHVNL